MRYKKILLILLIILAVSLLLSLRITDYLKLENIISYKVFIKNYISSSYFIASTAYVLTYIVITTLSIPGGTIMTLAGGCFFGIFPGLIYTNISAAIGATLSFLISRYLLKEFIQNKYKEKIISINKEIEENGHLHMLTLRLIPLFPFFLINIISGISNIKISTYLWTTAIGILPASLIFTYAGTAIEKIRSVNDIISKEILISFILLGILAQAPKIYKKLKK